MRNDSTTPRRATKPFDALFAQVARRRDVDPSAKIVYAKLTTMIRMGRSWTQSEIGAMTGLSRHQVWRALGGLIRADLVEVTRRGLGRPNAYTLKGVDSDDLVGSSMSPAARAKRIRETRLSQLIKTYGEMCLCCGSSKRLEIDHVIPRALGGPDNYENLQLLCRSCNQDKGATAIDFRQSPGVPLVIEVKPA